MNCDEPLGIYLHVPFCAERCAYCNFAIVTRQERRIPDFVAAVVRESATRRAELGPRSSDTLHVGGGTPSRLPAKALETLIEQIGRDWNLAASAEIALEVNPEDVAATVASDWRAVGVNRVTLGVQSLAPDGLAAIGRPGTVEEGLRALDILVRTGFDSVGIDLIFGRPGQRLEQWGTELRQALTLPIVHFSLYALETDGAAPLVRQLRRGERAWPSSDDAAAMYELATSWLAHAGFEPYEISNFAKGGARSRHNSKYWTDLPYLGLGPAAASYVDGRRWTMPRRLSEYQRTSGRPLAEHGFERYNADRRAGEALVFGLRWVEGVDLDRIARRHTAPAVESRLAAIERACRTGLAERSADLVRLTPRGRLLADELFVDLL